MTWETIGPVAIMVGFAVLWIYLLPHMRGGG